MRHRLPWMLVFVVTLAFFVRVYKVTSIAPSLSWDEVSIGYNAYSILKTGRDEHGKFLPVDAFVAYGDYKPPLAVYLTVPFVAVFGLNELAVRLPSVIAGTLAVVFTYLIVGELFYKRYNDYKNYNCYIPLVSALLLTISPWHIQLSRAGWEANIALTILLLGIWFVLKARQNPRLLIVCWIPLVLAMYAFNSARYVAPLLGALFLFWIKEVMVAHKKFALIGIVVALFLLAPLIPHLLSPEARLRFTEVNIFSDVTIIEKANERMVIDGNTLFSNIIHNRRVGFVLEYLKHFFDHFEPRFLFIRGDGNPKFSLQEVGQLYFIEAPFLVYGIYRLLITHSTLAWTLILWVLFAIAPAAAARETPHALRIENTLPVWQILIAYGLISLSKHRILRIAYFLSLIASVMYFWHNYFNHYAVEYSSEWQYGYKEALAEVRKLESGYERIVMTQGYGRPYMYTLFYTRTDPSWYFTSKRSTFDAAGFYHVFGFGKFEFRDAGPGPIERGTLYVTTPNETPEKIRILGNVRRPNGEPAFYIFDRP